MYYGDNSTHRPDHISWQYPVVRPDPRWPITYGQLSTPAGRKTWPNQVHGLILETSSIMDTHEDCLRCLTHVFRWNACMSGHEDKLASMCCEHNYWRKHAEEAEKASTFSQQQTSAAFKQACLLSMYIPSACPEDPTGTGPSSQPLEERLISPGGGSGVTPTSYSGEHQSQS